MEIEDYAWNQHEQEWHVLGRDTIPTPYKMKISDNLKLRIQLEEVLAELPQAVLAKWALANAQNFLPYLENPQDERIAAATTVLERRIMGEATAYEVRQAGFSANQLAKEATTEVGKFAARVFAQAIAVEHMRGHAIVSADYGVKVINLLFPHDLEAVDQERRRQIQLARMF